VNARVPAGDSRTSTQRRPLRVALAHDWLVGYRGGEAVLEAIARLLIARGDIIAGLYTMFADGQPIAPVVDTLPRTSAWINRLPAGSGRLRPWLLPGYPLAVRHLSALLARDHRQTPIDLVISTSSAVIKGLRSPRRADGSRVPHICYCHSPARYLWSQADQYAHGTGGLARQAGLALAGPPLRSWDKRSAARVATFIANSHHTRALIRCAFDRDADVIHPPVRIDYFSVDQSVKRSNHWLVAGALEPYKRVELVMAAARLSGAKLTIVGDGSQARALRSLAGPETTFTGRVSLDALRHHYRSAGVFIMPQVEDFGITTVEAQACGLPVAARRAGGALDSVVEHVTGEFFDQPTPEAIASAAQRVLSRCDWSEACRANAERFSGATFDSAFTTHLDNAQVSLSDDRGKPVQP
jgi:glycosyltransferase involved in cell wall biosynthesis